MKIKLFLGFCLLWILPIGLMLTISSGHLKKIQDFAIEEARVVLISSQEKHLQDLLAEEATRLSTLFTRIQDETYMLASYSQTILKNPAPVLFRNGSRYHLNKNGIYGNETKDGNSVLYVPQYEPSQDSVIVATESLDLLLKPLAEREVRMVFAWIVHRNGVTRAYPWHDFTYMPKEREFTSWPFYYLADPSHNPRKKVLFTPVYLDPLSREWMISCISPVYINRQFEATIGIDLTIENLLREIAGSRLPKGASSLLLSGSEIVAASANLPLAELGLDLKFPSHGQKLTKSALPQIREMSARIQAQKGNVSMVEISGQKVFVGHATVEPLGWKIVYLIPENELTIPANESARKILLETKNMRLNFFHILIFVVIGVVGISAIVIIHQSKGLRTLLRGIFELGNGNLSHRIPEDSSEFGQLAKALNSMARSLKEKTAELQRAFAEVEQGRKLTAVGRLAAGVAHEVNNPLATISTYTQMVLRRNDIPPDVSENMKVVMGEIQRIQEQLHNLLDLSRLQLPQITEIDPNGIIREIVGLVEYETATRGVNLHLSLCDDCQTIPADVSGFKQVVWNLVRNALDAQGKGGMISVKTYVNSSGGESSRFLFEIADEGPGIPEANVPHIFEPFFTTKEVGEGTGLGLSIVYNIVKNHGGTIEMRNLSPCGCLFKVALPITRDQ
ncbi:C4-dicarboxylate-specific signal transduction histidine kinase [Geobacter argillaceus]|uniref:histidine kinase n=1 Tax=Geobacter argillaceus TaxID=345631 RepID=A0A562VLB8_9BACT|nr:C4-dicarboxylate-specific signal transduction histidine kinase [Geobacter argillaceus]